MFGRGVEIKTPDQVAVMRSAGLVVAECLARVRAAVAPGVTTAELDAIARACIAEHGATSNFLGYGATDLAGTGGFPGVICTSVNDEVVHGIPGDRALREGDVISIDCGAVVDGWHGDAAVTVAVGTVAPEVAELASVTEAALWEGIAAAQPGGRLGDVGHAVQACVRAHGDYGIVDAFTGHGIGTAMHQEPDVPNTGRRGRGLRLSPGLVIAIEPMLTLGSPSVRILADDWTAVSADGSWAAHVEHSVAVTPEGPWVLTDADGGRARLAAAGVPCGAR
ncbi:methionine aminopeptidase, type I [Aeromicrobium marinum DSM 15272]|uniref:Methionine aminopeptidase n=1 Tax=Aeromicrobium marinum DSM 15272 TaxID=585531 RepID=E2SG68_9ACTN|nr:type I methionyl aminopeptidase [Aeromicrobium marinum]EFQ81825.1 methionine aminopeptidase, type I [Aeromicrobium marinum DSM 15272]